MPTPLILLLPLFLPLTATAPPPLTPLSPGRPRYELTCPTLPTPLRRGDANSCIDVIFRQLDTLKPPSSHGFPFTTNPAHALGPEYVVPFTFPSPIPGLDSADVRDNNATSTNVTSQEPVAAAIVATSRRSSGTEGATTSSRCFIRFDFWDRESGGPTYQHEEAWGMNLVIKYAGTAWDGCLRDRGDEGAGMGRMVPRPQSETLRLVIEVLAVVVDGEGVKIEKRER